MAASHVLSLTRCEAAILRALAAFAQACAAVRRHVAILSRAGKCGRFQEAGELRRFRFHPVNRALLRRIVAGARIMAAADLRGPT